MHSSTPAYQAPNQTQSYAGVAPPQQYPRQTIQQVQAAAAQQQQPQQYQPQGQQQVQQQWQSNAQQPNYSQYPNAGPPSHDRYHETYVLTDTANNSIPKDIRDRFPQDDEGRILFFTKPPQDTSHIVTGRSLAEKNTPLAHTPEYLEAKAKRDVLIAERKRKLQESVDRDNAANNYKRLKPGTFGEERDPDGRIRADPVKAAQIREEEEAQEQREYERKLAVAFKYFEDLQHNTATELADDYLRHYGSDASRMVDEDVARWKDRELKWRQEQELAKQARGPEVSEAEQIEADTKKMLSKNFWTGRFHDGTGRFEDDFDNRLPRPS